MKLIDLNVLLYVVNQDAAQHRRLLAWWTDTLSGDESVALPWIVILGFLRLTTNARVFPRPLTTPQAMNVIGEWLAADVVCLATEKDAHWATLRALLDETGTAGNLTTDAHLAALAITHGAVLVSCDYDFARFKALRWENPLD